MPIMTTTALCITLGAAWFGACVDERPPPLCECRTYARLLSLTGEQQISCDPTAELTVEVIEGHLVGFCHCPGVDPVPRVLPPRRALDREP